MAKLLYRQYRSCSSYAWGGRLLQEGLIGRGLSWQVVDVQKALRRAQSGAREDSLENGAQDLLRRSLPEGTAFSSDSTSSSGPSQELPLVRTSLAVDTACGDGHAIAVPLTLDTQREAAFDGDDTEPEPVARIGDAAFMLSRQCVAQVEARVTTVESHPCVHRV